MTQGIETMLNLPPLEEALRERGLLPEDPDPGLGDDGEETPDPELARILEVAQAAETQLATVEGKDHADAMDMVFKETLEHARNIVDLGFNIDHARAARMFEVAATMYSRAIEAKDTKRKRQLEAMKLALDKRKLDLEERKLKHEMGEQPEAMQADAVIVEDRNDLIKRLRAQMKGGE